MNIKKIEQEPSFNSKEQKTNLDEIEQRLGLLKEKIREDSPEMVQEIKSLRKLDIDSTLQEAERILPLETEGAAKKAIELIEKGWSLVKREIILVEPGHGKGHLLRDAINALRLVGDKEQDFSSTEAFTGIMIAGISHDIGCTAVKRYQETERLIRHGEAGALLVGDFLNSLKVEKPLVNLIKYDIAAHTHYLKPYEIKGEIVRPYRDTKEGNPYLAIWLPRWIDRLDTNGPGFVARHFLTLLETHKDYGKDGFYEVEFNKHMNPAIEKGTMLNHLKMFADSQDGKSPYSRFDHLSKRMVELRDAQTARLRKIIEAVSAPVLSPTSVSIEDILNKWQQFLVKIEPVRNNRRTASELIKRFKTLPYEWQVRWSRGFETTMAEYNDWEEEAKKDIERISQKFPFLQETTFFKDLLSFLQPTPSP